MYTVAEVKDDKIEIIAKVYNEVDAYAFVRLKSQDAMRENRVSEIRIYHETHGWIFAELTKPVTVEKKNPTLTLVPKRKAITY